MPQQHPVNLGRSHNKLPSSLERFHHLSDHLLFPSGLVVALALLRCMHPDIFKNPLFWGVLLVGVVLPIMVVGAALVLLD